MGGVERGCAVAHAAGHDMVDRQRPHRFQRIGVAGHAAARRLEAEQAGAARGNAQRSPTVVAVGHGNDSRRRGRRRTAARSARCPAEIPRVAAGAEQKRFGIGRVAELGRIGLAEDVEAGRLVAADQFAVAHRLVVAQGAAAHGHARAGDAWAEVFDQERHAGEGALGQAGPGGGTGALVHAGNDGIERRIEPVGMRDRFVEQFARAHLLAAHEIGQAERVVPVVFGECHIRSSPGFAPLSGALPRVELIARPIGSQRAGGRSRRWVRIGPIFRVVVRGSDVRKTPVKYRER